jgi:hypothetical protein
MNRAIQTLLILLAFLFALEAYYWRQAYGSKLEQRTYIGTGVLRAAGPGPYVVVGFQSENVMIELPPEKELQTSWPGYTVGEAYLSNLRMTVNDCYRGGVLVYRREH